MPPKYLNEENQEESLPMHECLNLHAARLSRAAGKMRHAARMLQAGNEITTRILDENRQLRIENEKLKSGITE